MDSGHCGIIDNEWADAAAGEIACASDVDPVEQAGISFQAAKAFVKREVNDPPTEHLRTKAVFDSTRDNAPLPRPDAFLIAQLRSGHCRKLAAYRNIVDANVSPNCPYCVYGIVTLEHWLQDYPATAAKRFRVMGQWHPNSPFCLPTRELFWRSRMDFGPCDATPAANNNNRFRRFNYYTVN